MIPRDSYEIIDTLIKQGRSFAIWRIPGEDRLHFRMQSAGSPCLLYDIKDLNERSGFVIAPVSGDSGTTYRFNPTGLL